MPNFFGKQHLGLGMEPSGSKHLPTMYADLILIPYTFGEGVRRALCLSLMEICQMLLSHQIGLLTFKKGDI